jgi:hypothetical protein
MLDGLVRGMEHSPRANPDLTSWVLSNTSLNDISHVDLFNVLRLDSSLLHGMFHSYNPKLGGSQRAKSAIDGANGGTGG